MKCGPKNYAKGGKVVRMAEGGAVMPSRPANFNPQGKGMERARFMRTNTAPMPTQASAGMQRAAAQAPALPSQAMGARPFKKGGMVKMAAGGSVKPRGASGRGVKACKVC